MIQDIAKNLNEVCLKKIKWRKKKILFADLFALKTPTTYPLFTFEKDKDGKTKLLVLLLLVVEQKTLPNKPFALFRFSGNTSCQQRRRI